MKRAVVCLFFAFIFLLLVNIVMGAGPKLFFVSATGETKNQEGENLRGRKSRWSVEKLKNKFRPKVGEHKDFGSRRRRQVSKAPVGTENLEPLKHQAEVVEAFKWAWDAYVKYAWGKDELKPLSKSGEDWFGLGLTLLDSLDTMYIMGLEDEFNAAKLWVEKNLEFSKTPKDVNLFETTIRCMGGLLSTYALSQDYLFLQKAEELGDLMLPAFETSSGIPFSDVNLRTKRAHSPSWGADSSTAEVATIRLEWKYLSYLTKRPIFREKVEKVNDVIAEQVANKGNSAVRSRLVPKFLNANTGLFRSGIITLGARGDSYYEYLLKQWIQTGKKQDVYLDRYEKAMESVFENLLKHTSGPEPVAYIGELKTNGQISPKMDHLVCFVPGMLALGWHHGAGSGRHLSVAKELMQTCYEMYARSPSGLAAEITYFDQNGKDMFVKPADRYNLLRPETVESLYILWRVTKDPVYRAWGWEIFKAFQEHCRVETGGYADLKDTVNPPFRKKDKMESFFLAETLKYFYLLFDEPTSKIKGSNSTSLYRWDLDHWVFNTEAHPLPILFDI